MSSDNQRASARNGQVHPGAGLRERTQTDAGGGDTTHRDAYERVIAGQLPACSLSELRVIGVRLDRMARARAKYGPLDLSNDRRDWNREAAEENVDRAFYLDCDLIARQDEERAQLHADVAAELAAAESIVSVSVFDPSRSSEVITALRELRDSTPELDDREPWDTSDVDTDETDITGEVPR